MEADVQGISAQDAQRERGGRPDRRHKQAAVLRVAREMFVDRGYRSTTMDEIASAAGVSKRTLYLWHEDKGALFRACIVEGARFYPSPVLVEDEGVHATLARYASSVLGHSAEATSLGIGRVLARDQYEFPDILPVAASSQEKYLIEPLSEWLREEGLELQGSTARARLFINMTLAPIHDRLLLGTGELDPAAIARHAQLVADIFLKGAAS